METQIPVAVNCPECGGPLLAVEQADPHELRCLVGHTFSLRSVLQAHSERQENLLWGAVAALLEAANLVEWVAAQVDDELAARLRGQSETKLRQAAEIRRMIEQMEPFDLE